MRKDTFPNPPALLVEVPKAVLNKLDLEDVLRFVIDARNKPASLGCVVAFGIIDSELAAAKVQQRRIASAKRLIGRNRAARRNRSMLFHDVHFYLICWGRISKLARFIVRTNQFPQARLVLNRYRTRLDEMIRFRDHLEHFEERLPGGSEQHNLKKPGDLFNIHGDSASIGGDRVDFGKASLRLLSLIVSEFKRAVLFDALTSLAEKDPTSAERLILNAARDVGLTRLMRQIRRNFQL